MARDWRRRAPVDEPAPTVLADTGYNWSGIAPAEPRGRTSVDKPPYRVPDLAEIEAVPDNGLTVASTFAGAGGSSTGYRMAGYRVAWASEFEPHAAATYRANHPHTAVDTRDIRTVGPEEIAEACDGVPDVLDGSPPCQSFSMAGKRSRGWGEVSHHADGTTQRSDDLFDEYVRLVDGLRPRAFVAENVAGLVAGVAKGRFKQVMAGLEACGYRVRAKVLDAQWLGVPQRRRRVFIVGVRDDLGADPPLPVPLRYRYSMLDACPWLAGDGELTARVGHAFTDIVVDMATVTASGDQTRWQLSRRGHGWYPGGEVATDEPAPTVTALGGDTYGKLRITTPAVDRARFRRRGVHQPTDKPVGDPAPSVQAGGIDGRAPHQAVLTDGAMSRKLTIAEVKRFCSFPDDYLIGGTYAQQWARLGNSVPPLMARAVAAALAPVLLADR